VKAIATISLAVCLLAVLAGCERIAEGPAAISREASGLSVTVCDSFSVKKIYAAVDYSGRGDDSMPAVELTGIAKLERGTPITSESVPSGLDGSWQEIDFDILQSVDIVFVGVDDSDGFQASFSSDDVLNLRSGLWLQTSGQVTDEPCPALN
jgi:hypothetical protein